MVCDERVAEGRGNVVIAFIWIGSQTLAEYYGRSIGVIEDCRVGGLT